MFTGKRKKRKRCAEYPETKSVPEFRMHFIFQNHASRIRRFISLNVAGFRSRAGLVTGSRSLLHNYSDISFYWLIILKFDGGSGGTKSMFIFLGSLPSSRASLSSKTTKSSL